MGPLPYPHRITFLATVLDDATCTPQVANLTIKVLSALLFDWFLRHPILSVSDFDDERLFDDHGRPLDVRHADFEDSVDWLFRVGRRHEVLWLELALDVRQVRRLKLRARLPGRDGGTWDGHGATLSAQLTHAVMSWLADRRLPFVPAVSAFDVADLRAASAELFTVQAGAAHLRGAAAPAELGHVPPRLAVPYYRVLAELFPRLARTLDHAILDVEPHHPVARRNLYVAGVLRGDADRRDILPVVADAPMYGKPHLSVWGEPFASDRPVEGMGVRHQGIAASLMPANPYACHNYSLQLAEKGRIEESYRWADRATVVGPDFGSAQLDCVRRLRQAGRPGHAYAEAQYRCRDIIERAAEGELPTGESHAPHHAALLLAFVHLDIGRLDEAIAMAEDALVKLPDDAATQEAFGWAQKRVAHWKRDAWLLARAYAAEGYHRGDPGRAVNGFMRGRLSDAEDLAMLIDALVALGREDEALIAFRHYQGIDADAIVGDGKARLAAAKAMMLAGELFDAMEQIQIVQLRRSQSRFESEINRLLRLACCWSAPEWERVIERRLDQGATHLAQLAARDLADFLPDFDTPLVREALGLRRPFSVEPAWIDQLADALPAAGDSRRAILERLQRPDDDSLSAADALAQDWWTALVPSSKDREAHAAGAVLALGVALARYLASTSGPPTPISGAYRHVATEALYVVRRARYHLDAHATHALLRLLDHLTLCPEWLLDTWLLRVERALDIEAEHGSYIENLVSDLPQIKRLLRGDERIGWELRLAHDLARDPSQYDAAAALFERVTRAIEGGSASAAWSAAAESSATPSAFIDVHWLAAVANPSGVAAPWMRLARYLFDEGMQEEAFAAARSGVVMLTSDERVAALSTLEGRWGASSLEVPFAAAAAYERGLRAASEGDVATASRMLSWAAAREPSNTGYVERYAMALVQGGHAGDAVRLLARVQRGEAPYLIGKALLDSGRPAAALSVLRYASRRFRTPEAWEALATAAASADEHRIASRALQQALDAGAQRDADLLSRYAVSLMHIGDFAACERLATELIDRPNNDRDTRILALHCMARSLAGRGRHVDAHAYAKAAQELGPSRAEQQELDETMARIVAQDTMPLRRGAEDSEERLAFAALGDGDLELAAEELDSESWLRVRCALAASEFRRPEDSGVPVAAAAIEAAKQVLARSVGCLGVHATLCRIRALRIRDNAFVQIDPPPPLGSRLTPEQFERQYQDRARRGGRSSTSAPLPAATTRG
jgi:tetratricopeptide (TPR) repeat protein